MGAVGIEVAGVVETDVQEIRGRDVDVAAETATGEQYPDEELLWLLLALLLV